MQARQILTLGQKGAKKFLERYDGQLICALIRYDEQWRAPRFTVIDATSCRTQTNAPDGIQPPVIRGVGRLRSV